MLETKEAAVSPPWAAVRAMLRPNETDVNFPCKLWSQASTMPDLRYARRPKVSGRCSLLTFGLSRVTVSGQGDILFEAPTLMKKVMPALAIMVVLTAPLANAASYIIHLKNAGELRTHHYWEEGTELKLSIYGGVIGIQKDFVVNIRELDASSREISADQSLRAEISNPRTTVDAAVQVKTPLGEEAGRGITTGTQSGDEKVDFESYKERKLALKKKLDEALERFREASGNKDIDGKNKALEEVTKLSNQIFELTDELKAKNKGVLPDWWEKV